MSGRANIRKGKSPLRKHPNKDQHVEEVVVNGVKVQRIVDDSKPKTQSSTKNN